MVYENYSKQLGKIYEIECERSLSTAFHMNHNDWRNDKEKCPNGPLMQLGIHFIDFFNDMFGDFDIEYSRLENFNAINDDYYIGIINYKDLIIKLKFSYISNNTFNIKINAEKFNLEFDGTELKKIHHNGKIEKIKANKTDSLEYSINEFYSYVKNKNIDSNTNRAINAIERLGSYARNI